MTHGRSASTLGTVRALTADEWRLDRIARANVLLVASDGSAEKIVDALRPGFCQPITVWYPASRLILPPIGATGTLLLRDVGEMPRDDQRRLCDWLEVTAGTTRVVSTSRQPLLSLLKAGTFSETLYYRLNVLRFYVTECDS
jgi:Sigma-54 interaction domain